MRLLYWIKSRMDLILTIVGVAWPDIHYVLSLPPRRIDSTDAALRRAVAGQPT
jgi:hypothetical protein